MSLRVLCDDSDQFLTLCDEDIAQLLVIPVVFFCLLYCHHLFFATIFMYILHLSDKAVRQIDGYFTFVSFGICLLSQATHPLT